MSGIKTACVRMSGPSVTMDQRGSGIYVTPISQLPIKCTVCTFPDLDFVASPYLLARGFSDPAETAPAMIGNFLVRDGARRILEAAVPDACAFHPTAEAKSGKMTSWFLAVPNQILAVPVPKPPPPFCPKCGEPMGWPRDQGEVWRKMAQFDSRGVDLFKTQDWRGGTDAAPDSNPPWTRLRIERDLYFSVRLEQLLMRAKVKGHLKRGILFDEVEPNAEDEAWIETKLKLLTQEGLLAKMGLPARKASAGTRKWFGGFLKRNAVKSLKKVDFEAIGKKHKLELPKDYKEFISKIGSKSFKNVNGVQGTVTTILLPREVDFKNHRRGKMVDLAPEDRDVDGVVFAEMDSGDSFVFDVSVKNTDYPVYWYRHEESFLESFAPNFAECIKRFVEQN